jgi:hypothetical protein
MPKFDEAVIEPAFPEKGDMTYDGLNGAEIVFGRPTPEYEAEGYELEAYRLETPVDWAHALRVRQEQVERIKALDAPAIIVAAAEARIERTKEGLRRAVHAQMMEAAKTPKAFEAWLRWVGPEPRSAEEAAT